MRQSKDKMNVTTFEVITLPEGKYTRFTLPDGTVRTAPGIKNPKEVAKAIDAMWKLSPNESRIAEDYSNLKY